MNNGSNILLYNESAQNWNEALPLGNGRIGAMVYGGAKNEQIGLNEDTLWTGKPVYYSNPNGAEVFKKAQRLALDRKYPEAQTLIEDEFTSLWTQMYQPLGDLYISMSHSDNVSDYKRTLDISLGVALVEYNCNGINFKRE